MKKKLASIARKGVCLVGSAAMASLMVVPCANAAPQGGWSAPDSSAAVDSNIISVGAHGSAVVEADILGLNSTSLGDNSISLTNASEAGQCGLLGVFGSAANTNPNPYYQNLFYSVATGKTVDDCAIQHTNVTVAEPSFNANAEPTSGVSSDLSLRPDIVVGISGVPAGTGSKINAGRLVVETTTSKNHATWGSGSTLPSQAYAYVLGIRALTNDSSLANTRNTDGNLYVVDAEHYRDGDNEFDPVGVEYTSYTVGFGYAQTQTGTDAMVTNVNNLSVAAERVASQKSGKTGRYGNPVTIANEYEMYAKGLKWYVLSQIASGAVKKKTVAVVVDTDASAGTFTLAKLNTEGDDTPLGSLSVGDATSDTVTDLANTIAPSKAVGSIDITATAEQMKQADVIICVPNISTTYKASKADVEAAFAKAGVAPTASIFDNVLPEGVVGNSIGFNRSAESTQLVGLVQGFIYPELFSTMDSLAYYGNKFYHMTEEAVKAFYTDQLSGTSLPEGESADTADYSQAAVDRIQKIIDEGTAYYYANKTAIDKAHPIIASSDYLDYHKGYNTTKLTINVPEGATVSLIDVNELPVLPQADGTYAVSKSTDCTLTVDLDGYSTYSTTVKAGTTSVNVALGDLSKIKKLTVSAPEGAKVVVRDSSDFKVDPNEDGTYTLSASATAKVVVSLDGYQTYTAEVAPEATEVAITEDMLTAITVTKVTVPAGSTFTLLDANGLSADSDEDYNYLLVNGAEYTLKVSLAGYQDYTETIIGGEKENIKVLKIDMEPLPTSVTINKAAVTAAAVKAVMSSTIKTVVLGTSVKSIAKQAFKGTPVTTLNIKSTKLTKAKVKACLTSSKITTVKVPSSKLTAYKKIFTKANCGKSVKVVKG